MFWMIFSIKQKWVFMYSWSTILWYRCYYPHRSRDAFSPVCGNFVLCLFFYFPSSIDKYILENKVMLSVKHRVLLHFRLVSMPRRNKEITVFILNLFLPGFFLKSKCKTLGEKIIRHTNCSKLFEKPCDVDGRILKYELDLNSFH